MPNKSSEFTQKTGICNLLAYDEPTRPGKEVFLNLIC